MKFSLRNTTHIYYSDGQLNDEDYQCNPITIDDGSPCKFPFIYNNKEFTSCTNVESEGRPWCATAVKDNGELEREDSYGYCNCK